MSISMDTLNPYNRSLSEVWTRGIESSKERDPLLVTSLVSPYSFSIMRNLNLNTKLESLNNRRFRIFVCNIIWKFTTTIINGQRIYRSILRMARSHTNGSLLHQWQRTSCLGLSKVSLLGSDQTWIQDV